MSLEQAGMLITMIVSIFALAIAVRKTKPDLLSMSAKTSQTFQAMLEEEVEKGIAKDKTILGMKVRIKSLEKEYEKICIENTNLKNWCKRLVKQVVAAGGTPIEMDCKD